MENNPKNMKSQTTTRTESFPFSPNEARTVMRFFEFFGELGHYCIVFESIEHQEALGRLQRDADDRHLEQ